MTKPSPFAPNSSCHYCNAPATTRDHIIPRAVGGRDGVYNLVPSCEPCNAKKADSMPTCRCKKCKRAVFEFHLRVPVGGYERYSGEQASWSS